MFQLGIFLIRFKYILPILRKILEISKVPVKRAHTKTLNEYLKKSFSFNDLHNLDEGKLKENVDFKSDLKRNQSLQRQKTVDGKMSNYFYGKPNKTENARYNFKI